MREIRLSSLIELMNVTKHYWVGNTQYPVIRGIDLRVARGDMVAIMGVSGSGKSTLMNIMGLLDHPSSGEYYLDGRAVAALHPDELASLRNQKMGFVFQSFYLLPRMTVLENVMLPLIYRRLTRDVAAEKAKRLLHMLDMAAFAHHYPMALSGGQQQRVAIARALVGDPDVILADEPTGALDSTTRLELLAIFERLHRQDGRTLVMITHDQEVSRRCQTVFTLEDGRWKA